MNKITVNFIECDPAPNHGYNILWRVAGSSDPLQDAGNFSSSPAVFFDNTNPDGTDYEGVIRSDCSESGESGTNYGDPIAWTTFVESGGGSGQGNLVNLRFDIVEAGLCGAATIPVYLDGVFDIAPGNIIYDDINLTTPHQGDLFVSSLSGPNYNLDVTTGEVGAATGNSC